MMNRGYWYSGAGAAFFLLGLGLWNTPVSWLFFWTAFSCLYISLGYLLKRGELFFKSKRGRVPRWIKVGLGPLFLFTHGYHWMVRRKDHLPPVQKVEPGLYLGRRLLPGDEVHLKEEKVTAVLDMTVEFDALPERCREAISYYLNIPVYDHHIPRRSQMARALRWIDNQRKAGHSVLIHCALGQGRSVMVLLGYLLWENPGENLEALLKKVKNIRETARPNRRQREFLESFREEMPRKIRRKTALIFNPFSGRRGGAHATEGKLERIRRLLGPYFDMETYLVERDKPMESLWHKVKETAPEQVWVHGGDGTVSEVAAWVMNTGIPLGILPGGTANALASCLFKDPVEDTLLEEGCRRIILGKTRDLDAGLCNGKPYFLLVGIGWEAGMVREASEELKARWGVLAYLLGGLEQMGNLEDFEVTLEIDGNKHRFRATNLVIANAVPQFSLFAQGTPDVEPYDGFLNLTAVVNIRNRAEGAKVIADLIQWGLGRKTKNEHILTFKGKNIRVETSPPQTIVRDGEVESRGSLDIRIVERALQVFA